jgi:hypothetical protein
VVELPLAIYILCMRDATDVAEFQVIERMGPAIRVVLRQAASGDSRLIVITGYRGPRLPDALTRPEVTPAPGTTTRPAKWRLTAEEGAFEFDAATVDVVEQRPSLYAPLHRAFTLSATDRWAVRLLLWALRLPGGARLLRRWHGARSA